MSAPLAEIPSWKLPYVSIRPERFSGAVHDIPRPRLTDCEGNPFVTMPLLSVHDSLTDIYVGNGIGRYLYPLLYEYVEALEDFVAVREALGGLVASLRKDQESCHKVSMATVLLATNLLF